MKRFRLVFTQEVRSTLRRPMIWVLFGLVGLTAFGLSSGNLTISSGDSSVGGTKAWITSEFAVTQVMTFVFLLFYSFFVAVAAGMSTIRDRELKVDEILNSTPLGAGEYVWGKFAGVTVVFLAVLAAHTFFNIVFFQWMPNASAEEIRGPFSLLNYVKPALLFCVPTLIFFVGLPFSVGLLTRRPILVFFFPVAVLLACGFFLWNWTPTWLSPFWNRVLMVLDPGAFRWLNETLLKVDRGVDFYNSAAVPLDGVFLLNRALVVGLGLGAVVWAHYRFSRTQRSTAEPGRLAGLFSGWRRKVRPVHAVPADLSAAALGQVSFMTAVRAVTRTELRELRSQPGLYLFVPLILLQTIGSTLTALGAFGTPVLLTSGTMAVGAMNTLTLMVCLLLMFYMAESLQREYSTGVGSIFYSTSVPTTAVLFGKALANSLVGAVIMAAMLLACLIGQQVQAFQLASAPPFRLMPFVLTWGLLLFPTFLVWTSFITLVQAVGRNRYLTYGVGLGALIAGGYYQFTGKMNWAFNWNLWNAVRWSDMGTYEFNRQMLVWNRLAMLLLGIFFVVAAVRFFRRRDWDAGRLVERFYPKSIAWSLLTLLPFGLPPVVVGGLLYRDVMDGFQGSRTEKTLKDYWRRNLATYKDFPLPSVGEIELDLELDPPRHWFGVEGTYRLFNHHGEALREIPMTPGLWDDLEWSLNGEPFEPEDRSGLAVFKLPQPLEKGEEVMIGFSHNGTVPRGVSRNGGGASQFILPSGVVLHSFSPTFVPLLGYQEGIGVDEENSYDSREYPDDFYEAVLDPFLGSPTPFTTRVSVTGPEEYTFNSVGILESEEVVDGRRTAVWRSDHPVKILNVVGGKWDVVRKDGTAVFYHPEHDYNIEEISDALAGARRYYSEWFYPYPWEELKLSEFPNMASYAQGFGTNITFSEGIGFLTRSEPRTNTAFLVTAHESAHQWWANILTPGRGPGGNILSEGMSHFATILLMEKMKGNQSRIEFCKRIEERYGDSRQVDSERPLVKIDGSRAGDTTVTYDKGGWVAWMLLQMMGREETLEGLRDFIRRYEVGPDYPVLQDFVAVLREHAPDPEAFDAFVDQWYFDVVVPQYRFSDVEMREADGEWKVSATLTNRGTGRMPVGVALSSGERFAEDTGAPPYHEVRRRVLLGAGESIDVVLTSPFRPERLLVDPDALVLQLERELAVHEF